jgi:hypothetical protein
MEDRGDNPDVAQTEFNALQNPFRFDDRPTIAFLPVDLVVAFFSKAFVNFRNEEVCELLDPHRSGRIAINYNRLDGFGRKRRHCSCA